ncbi:MAG: hypothetical protein IJ435_03590 [Clostridia bacterium]|nr:hypothetical protein [Clostridia bacterium]
MATSRPRFSVTVSEEMYEQINDFQHKRKMSTQTKAIVEILEIGLQALLSDSDVSSPKTTEYPFVVDKGIAMYMNLDEIDKAEIRGEMKQMLKAEKYVQAQLYEEIPVAARNGKSGTVKVTSSPEERKAALDKELPGVSTPKKPDTF